MTQFHGESKERRMDSILTSIKKLLGIDESIEDFDLDLIIHINSVFMILNQMGVGPEEGYTISSKDNVWSEFTNDNNSIEAVKSYVYLKTRLMFDPPTGSSALVESINNMIKELEWRLYIVGENQKYLNSKGGAN